jgi:hypothetical protein
MSQQLLSKGNFGEVFIIKEDLRADQQINGLTVVKRFVKDVDYNDELRSTQLIDWEYKGYLKPVNQDDVKKELFYKCSLGEFVFTSWALTMISEIRQMHQHGVSHNDIKLSNISPTGHLLDPGLMTKIGVAPDKLYEGSPEKRKMILQDHESFDWLCVHIMLVKQCEYKGGKWLLIDLLKRAKITDVIRHLMDHCDVTLLAKHYRADADLMIKTWFSEWAQKQEIFNKFLYYRLIITNWPKFIIALILSLIAGGVGTLELLWLLCIHGNHFDQFEECWQLFIPQRVVWASLFSMAIIVTLIRKSQERLTTFLICCILMAILSAPYVNLIFLWGFFQYIIMAFTENANLSIDENKLFRLMT